MLEAQYIPKWVRFMTVLEVTCEPPELEFFHTVKFGSCSIEKTAHGDNSAAIPSYRGRTQITSSCVANDNCQNSVHVISVYEARSTGFNVQSGSVSVRVSATGEDTKPLILVLTSYYPIRWSLNIPSGVVFDKVIVVRRLTVRRMEQFIIATSFSRQCHEFRLIIMLSLGKVYEYFDLW